MHHIIFIHLNLIQEGFYDWVCELPCSLAGAVLRVTHQESRCAVQQASDPCYETSVEKAGELRRNDPRLWRVEQAAHHKLVTLKYKTRARVDYLLEGFKMRPSSLRYLSDGWNRNLSLGRSFLMIPPARNRLPVPAAS